MVAGLVLGIVSLVFSWIPFVFVLALIGLPISIIGRKNAITEGKPSGVGTAGLVLCIIGLIFGILGTICTVGACIAATTALTSTDWWDALDYLFY